MPLEDLQYIYVVEPAECATDLCESVWMGEYASIRS
jgi:hypothetical protein